MKIHVVHDASGKIIAASPVGGVADMVPHAGKGQTYAKLDVPPSHAKKKIGDIAKELTVKGGQLVS